MLLADVDVLVTACISRAERHADTRRWLINNIRDQAPFAIYDSVLASVVRVSTDPRIWQYPAATLDALQFCDMLRTAPGSVRVVPSPSSWATFRSMMLECKVHGKRTSDVFLAALAIDLDATFYSFDKGFANYPGLKWRLPEI